MPNLTTQEATILATWKTRPCVVISMPGRFEDAQEQVVEENDDQFSTICNFDLDEDDNAEEVVRALKTIIAGLEDRSGTL